jgi:hypothetical protein
MINEVNYPVSPHIRSNFPETIEQFENFWEGVVFIFQETFRTGSATKSDWYDREQRRDEETQIWCT